MIKQKITIHIPVSEIHNRKDCQPGNVLDMI